MAGGKGWRPAAAILLAAGLLPAGPGRAETVIGGTVQSLLEFARERHPEFAAMRLEAEAAQARVQPAGALPDPVFRLELRDLTNRGTDAAPNVLPARIGSTRYTVIQPLPWFGKRDLKEAAAAAGAEEAEGRARGTWADLALRIKQNYAVHHYHQAAIRLNQESLDLMARVEDIARTRYAAGLVPQQDVVRAQTEQTAMRADLAAMEGDSAQASARMRALLGRPPDVRLRPPDVLRPMPAAAALEFAALEARLRAANPWLQADEARIRSAESNRELTYRNRYPDLSLGVSPIQTRNRVNEWEVMLELNIPLQQESRRSQEREAERMLDAARMRREASLNQALSDLGESLAGLEAARRLEQLTETRMLPQADLGFRAALAAYENGRVDFATLLDAQRQIRKARQDLVKARSEQRIRLAEIERLVGEDL
ncbi:MAG: TolC family protein [Rhodocyclaceae bacterium]|nr:TolC family protein [Rhodocyclaceae bacterium]